MPREIKYHSHYANILYVWLHLGDLFKQERLSRLVTVIAAKLTSHLSVWFNHVLERLNELQFIYIHTVLVYESWKTVAPAQKIGREIFIDISC